MPNWGQVLQEIQSTDATLRNGAVGSIDKVRRKYLRRLFSLTGRPTIAYYSGWLSNPGSLGFDINDEDKSAFMMAIHGLPKDKGLDLILHTPGGGIAAAESLVDYLKRIFGNDIRAIVPHLAMSAGTMIACACKSIVMAKHSNLGPIDPQISGLPAAAVKKELLKALEDFQKNPETMKYWQFILQKYNPTFIGQCEQAVEWSQQFVRKSLIDNMLSDNPEKEAIASHIVDTLSDVEKNKSHSRHIHIDDCISMGLNIEKLEEKPKFQDAVLTVHHCYMHSLSESGAGKIVENHQGAAFIKITRR
jgi:Serine dehydrogenase proteinase